MPALSQRPLECRDSSCPTVDHVCPLDRRVEIHFSLRDMAIGAKFVVELRTAGMVHSCRKIHVVVTGSAGLARRVCKVCCGLRSAALLRMTGRAIPWIRGISGIRDFRKIRSVYEQPLLDLHARQLSPMCSSWIITLKSSELPLLVSTIAGYDRARIFRLRAGLRRGTKADRDRCCSSLS